MRNELLVLLPAYNEEENVQQMVESWKKQENMISELYDLSLQIIVINDGSKDGTEEICNQLSKKYDNITLINHPQNKGLGEAIKTGILYAIKNPSCRFACIMDCDNTQDPKYIKDMLDKIGVHTSPNEADVVIASRYRKGSKVQGVSKIRLLTSEGAKHVYSAIIPVKKVRDYTCGYRLYTIDILQQGYRRFGEDIIEESGFTCMAELLYKLYIVGARFEEIPFVLRYDYKQGQSKMKVLKTAGNSIKLTFRLRKIKK